MYRIAKEFSFSASHQLTDLPDGHPCTRLHGHNYTIIVELAGETLNEHGFLRDYRELEPLRTYIDSTFDHRHLNDVMGNGRTTSECLAKHFYDWCKTRFPETVAVRVSETPRIWAEYRP